MGYSKVVNKGNGKVVFVHQLDGDGSAYAEDITVEVQEGVSPDRVDFLAKQDGKIGSASVYFTAAPEGDYSEIKFPGDGLLLEDDSGLLTEDGKTLGTE